MRTHMVMSKHSVFFISLRIWFYCFWHFLRLWLRLRHKYKQNCSEIPAEPEIKREQPETFPGTAHKLFQVRQHYNYVQTPITKKEVDWRVLSRVTCACYLPSRMQLSEKKLERLWSFCCLSVTWYFLLRNEIMFLLNYKKSQNSRQFLTKAL